VLMCTVCNVAISSKLCVIYSVCCIVCIMNVYCMLCMSGELFVMYSVCYCIMCTVWYVCLVSYMLYIVCTVLYHMHQII